MLDVTPKGVSTSITGAYLGFHPSLVDFVAVAAPKVQTGHDAE